MNIAKFYLLIILVLITGLLPQKNVSADMGPKPSMDFEFVQEVAEPELTIVSAILYFCEQPDCNDAQMVPEAGQMGPYGFSCADQSCLASYGGTYYQLEVAFSDGITRKSNIFDKSHLNAKYKVTIESNSLSVEELEGYDVGGNYGKLINNILLIIAGIVFIPLLISVPIMRVRRRQGRSTLLLGTCLVVFICGCLQCGA